MKNVYERYGYFLKYIRLIGNLPTMAQVTPKSLEMGQATSQMAYREMNREQFRWSVVAYLSYVSSYYLFERWAVRVLDKYRDAIPRGDASDIFTDCLADHRIDGMNTIRIFPNLPIANPKEGWSERLTTLKTRKGYSETVESIVSLLASLSVNYDSGYEWAVRHPQTKLAMFTMHYLKIQSVTPGSDPSFLTTTTNQQPHIKLTTTNRPPGYKRGHLPARYPSIISRDTAPSGASEAKRSEASSHKAPAGAAKKTRRATTPESTPPQHRSGDTDAQPKSTRTS